MSANITVYIVVNLTINDPDEYRIYEKGFFSYLQKHNESRNYLQGPKEVSSLY